MFFVAGSSVRVLKAATFKRFSVRPYWSPIVLKLQNFIAGVFQCIFNKISEHVFNRTTMNWYFETKKGRCKHWSSIVLFESGITSEETKVQIFKFLLQVSVRYHFRGVMFKERLWPRKSNTNIVFVGKERKYFYLRNQEVLCKNHSWKSCSTKDHQRIHLCEENWCLELLMLNIFQCSLLNFMKLTSVFLLVLSIELVINSS